jgi:hypothetical protein
MIHRRNAYGIAHCQLRIAHCFARSFFLILAKQWAMRNWQWAMNSTVTSVAPVIDLLPDLDNYAERRGQIAQVIIFFESVFTIKDHKGRAFILRKRAGVPRAFVQFERA